MACSGCGWSVTTADQVPVAVADALGMPMDGAAAERDLRERIYSYLARRRLLLVLDNCEHVVDAAAGLADDILGRCADVTVLATSREALAVPDEVQVNIGPLDTPPDDAPARRSSPTPAAQLFVERARAVRPGTVHRRTHPARDRPHHPPLDGIPLAVELAAARAGAMSPLEISDRLDRRFALLTSGSRTAEARQQTLRATVDWSYALLSEDEQRAFDRLSLFQGGWAMDAAEAVSRRRCPRGVRPRDRRTPGRTVHGGRRTRSTHPYRMLKTLRLLAERLDRQMIPVGRGPARPPSPRTGRSPPSSRFVATDNARRWPGSGRNSRTCAPHSPGSAARTVTSTRPSRWPARLPCSGTSADTSRAGRPPAAPGARGQ